MSGLGQSLQDSGKGLVVELVKPAKTGSDEICLRSLEALNGASAL